MNDNKADVIRLRSLVVSVSDTLEDLMIEEAFIPDKLRYRLAILDEYVFSFTVIHLVSETDFSGLQHIQKELDAMCLEGRFQRFIRASKRRTYLAQLREDLIATDRAIQASSMTVVRVKLDRTVSCSEMIWRTYANIFNCVIGRENRSTCCLSQPN